MKYFLPPAFVLLRPLFSAQFSSQHPCRGGFSFFWQSVSHVHQTGSPKFFKCVFKIYVESFAFGLKISRSSHRCEQKA